MCHTQHDAAQWWMVGKVFRRTKDLFCSRRRKNKRYQGIWDKSADGKLSGLCGSIGVAAGSLCTASTAWPLSTGASRHQSRQWLPCMGLSRTGHTGQSICTTSIRLNHSAMGSIPESLPSGGRKGTPASRASTATASARFSAFTAWVSALVLALSEKLIEQIRFVEQGKVLTQLIHVERGAVYLQ